MAVLAASIVAANAASLVAVARRNSMRFDPYTHYSILKSNHLII